MIFWRERVENLKFPSLVVVVVVPVIGTIRGFDFLFPSSRDAVFPANESIKPVDDPGFYCPQGFREVFN